MSEAIHAIFGAGGFGRQAIAIAARRLAAEGRGGGPLLFIDDQPTAASVNGWPVLDFDAFRRLPGGERRVAIAISDSRVREAVATRLADHGIAPWTVCAMESLVLGPAEIGEGAILSPFATVTVDVRIGRHFHANLHSYLSHDSVVGDFVTFAPGVKCNGNVVIGDHAYIGTGAVIRQGRPGAPLVIGRGAVVGMGAVVLRDVPDGVVVVGNPARPLDSSRRPPGVP